MGNVSSIDFIQFQVCCCLVDRFIKLYRYMFIVHTLHNKTKLLQVKLFPNEDLWIWNKMSQYTTSHKQKVYLNVLKRYHFPNVYEHILKSLASIFYTSISLLLTKE